MPWCGRPGQAALVDQARGRVPLVPEDVEVEVLQGRGLDQLPAPGEDAGGLGAGDRLAAREGDEVGALGQEAPEVGGRGQLSGGVDDDGHRGGAGDLDHRGQLRLGVGIGDVDHGRGVVVDGGGVLPGLGVAHAGAAEAVGDADLHQLDAHGAHGVVVEVAVAAGHDHAALHAGRVGQAVHAGRVEAGDAGRGAQQQARGGAAGDVPGLGAGVAGDDGARRGLQLGDVDARPAGLGHGRGHLRRHDRAAQPGGGAGSVDDGAHAEALVHAAHRISIPLCIRIGSRDSGPRHRGRG